ncbi:MAG: peptidyl-prolyl cis-trans isomerase [Pyrinomonadaceae bacterium]|nr:peptidyl-prolyl cis-trans isomerase [Pyrinomonadaceae bacterium]
MLKQLSRLERTRSLIIILFALLMVVSLVFFFAPTPNSALATPANSTETLARVGREDVTVGDFTTARNNYLARMQQMQQMFGGQNYMPPPNDQLLLRGLVSNRLVAQEAARLGLAASDAEVAQRIRREFSTMLQGKNGFERYKQAVSAQYGGVEPFERQMRDSIAAEKLQAYVTAGVQISEEEVLEDYKRRNTSFDIVYAPITVAKLATKVGFSDEDLRAYYDQHKTDFRILEPQRNVRYIFIDQAKVGEKLQISDEELRAEYEKLSPENKQAGVRVQQIVLKVARPDLDDQVRTKAEDLVRRARTDNGRDGKATEEAFAELARGNSEDAATARSGGQLSSIVRRNPNKPDDPLQQTLTMEPSQVSEPIKYGTAYYIFRRGEAVPKTFEDARQELLVSLRNRRAYAAAAGVAAKAAEQLKETKDPQRVAQGLAAEVNMNPNEMVRETGFVKPGDDVPNIGSSPEFEQAIEPLNNPNDTGERVAIKGGFAVPMLVEKRDPRIPDLDEVKDKVAQGLREERARTQLEQTARDLAANANSAGDLKAAAERLGLEAQTSAAYKLGAPLGEAGTSPAADESILNLQAGEVAKTPIKIGDSWVVVGVTKRTETDLVEFAKQREQLMESALEARRNEVFEDYLATVRAKRERGGDIKIYDDVLAKVSEDTVPFAAPPSLPTRRAPVPTGQ